MQKIWKNLPSSTIPHRLALEHHVAEEVIKNRGSNKFLYSKYLHADVQVKFENTDKGIINKISLKHEK